MPCLCSAELVTQGKAFCAVGTKGYRVLLIYIIAGILLCRLLVNTVLPFAPLQLNNPSTTKAYSRLSRAAYCVLRQVFWE